MKLHELKPAEGSRKVRNRVSITNASKHICNWICHDHIILPPSRSWDYQLAFFTPGICPL